MVYSRAGRLEEKRLRKRLLLAVTGIVGILIFMAVFGFKLLIGFSVGVDMIRGKAVPTPTPSLVTLQIPTLDPIPIATKSSVLRLNGTGTPGLTLTVFVDDKETKKTIIAGNGGFTVQIGPIKDGQHSITASVSNDVGNQSHATTPISVLIKNAPPILEVNEPDDNATIRGENKMLQIKGNTESDTTITVNGRIAVILPDNSFTLSYPLSAGGNTLTVVATDLAGNTTQTERRVTYEP